MFCGYCGKENADDYSFCSKCGKPLKSDVQNKDTHSTSTPIPPSDTHQEKLDTETHKADIPLKSDVQNKDIQSTPKSIISTDTHQENSDTETHKSDTPQSHYISVHWWKDCEWPWQAKSLDDKELLGNYETELEAAKAVAKFHGTNRINLLANPLSTESEKEEKRKLLCKEVLEKKNSTHAKPKSSEVASEDYLSSDSSQAYTTPKTSKPSELTTEKQKISKNKIPVNSSNANDEFKEVENEAFKIKTKTASDQTIIQENIAIKSVAMKTWLIIGKVFLSLLASMVGALLGEIIGGVVLNIGPKLLTTAFIWVLVFPVWYPSRILFRLASTIVGPIVVLLFWSISLAFPIEAVFMIGIVRTGAWGIAMLVQLIIMRQGRVLPVVGTISFEEKDVLYPELEDNVEAISKQEPTVDASPVRVTGPWNKRLLIGWGVLAILWIIGVSFKAWHDYGYLSADDIKSVRLDVEIATPKTATNDSNFDSNANTREDNSIGRLTLEDVVRVIAEMAEKEEAKRMGKTLKREWFSAEKLNPNSSELVQARKNFPSMNDMTDSKFSDRLWNLVQKEIQKERDYRSERFSDRMFNKIVLLLVMPPTAVFILGSIIVWGLRKYLPS